MYKYSIGDFESFNDADEFRKSCGVQNAFVFAYKKGSRNFSNIDLSKASDVNKYSRKEGYNSADITSDLIFNIQVAASKIRLNKEQLSKIYSGICTVQMIEEDGWYKYQIVGFRLYSDALKVMNQCGVKGAFIIAYQNGIKLKTSDAVNNTKSLEQTIRQRGRRGIVKEIDFYVQITATKFPLSESELNSIYHGTYKPIQVIEENWYKYMISSGSEYTEANNIKNSCGVPKAFVVAYKRGKRIPLFYGITESRIE